MVVRRGRIHNNVAFCLLQLRIRAISPSHLQRSRLGIIRGAMDHPYIECKDRHCAQHEAIWDRLESCGEVDIAEDGFEFNFDPVRHEEAMKRVCTSCERTLREHTPEEYVECFRDAPMRNKSLLESADGSMATAASRQEKQPCHRKSTKHILPTNNSLDSDRPSHGRRLHSNSDPLRFSSHLFVRMMSDGDLSTMNMRFIAFESRTSVERDGKRDF
jgi:hypothetical protein